MRLIRLTLRNFKGIRDFTLEADGYDVDIYGDNATGKTTLFDAFLWLLFDKDSQNRKDFEIKTLGPDGQPVHGLDHEVEAVLEAGGRSITLKKVFKEKWTKKRGSATAEFTGHTTDYYIDGVPVKKNEYDARVAQIADEAVFKLLTNPTYFNEQLHWQERRRILLEVCGDISDQEVIASDKSLSRLPEILQGRKLDDHRKVIMARRTEINKELERIPVRIDEVQQGLPKLDTSATKGTLADDIARAKAERAKKQEELAQLKSGGPTAEAVSKMWEIEGQMLRLKQTVAKAVESELAQTRASYETLQSQLSEVRAKLMENEQKADSYALHIRKLEADMAELRKEWYRVDAEAFEGPDICPTCGQPLPQEQIEEARSNFNRQKAERLEAINKQGRAAKAEAERLAGEIAKLGQEREELKKAIDALTAKAAKLRQQIERLSQPLDISSDPKWIALQKSRDELEKQVSAIKAGNTEAVYRLEQDIATLDAAVEALEKAMAQIDARDRGLARIEELKAEERKLAAEYERLEQELYMTEQFIRTKVRLLEEKINSRFKLARFKLFDVQVNGGVVECCETLYQGVPYSGGLNNAARINVGLDIINVLSEHYGFDAPVFIDNAEAITCLLPTRGQQIRLFVSEADKALRVEVNDQGIAYKEAV
ncbi:MAG: AAA family ATPase [Clostridia bacterium]|nr:AAA family ATPase [Clostridia bacterium]